MVEGINSSMIYLIHYKNFCKCHNVPPPSTTIKKGEEKKKIKVFSLFCYLIFKFLLKWMKNTYLKKDLYYQKKCINNIV
jgi:hypothetical protein